MQDDAAALIARVRAVYPALALDPTQARLETGGQNNLVLIAGAGGDAGERYVFRFPRHQQALDRMRAEVALLRALVPALPLPIPEPRYWTEDGGPGAAFMGYALIPGSGLRREVYARLEGTAAGHELAAQVGAFLWALHHIPIAALPIRPPVAAERATWDDLYHRIRARLFPLMRPAARDEVAAHFEAALGDATFWRYQPALIHGDFGTDNILLDAAAGRLSGVIDFGSAGTGDPANDLAALTSRNGLPESFVALMEPAYPGATALLERARFYRGTFALQYALFGAEMSDDEALRDGLARYR